MDYNPNKTPIYKEAINNPLIRSPWIRSLPVRDIPLKGTCQDFRLPFGVECLETVCPTERRGSIFLKTSMYGEGLPLLGGSSHLVSG